MAMANPIGVLPNAKLSHVSVFRNTSTSGSLGTSSFAAKVDFAEQAISHVSSDRRILDGDGKPDLGGG